MSLEKESPPAWWNPIGKFAHQPDEKNEFCLTFTTKSAHLKIRRLRWKDLWSVRWIIFGRNDGRVEGYKVFTSAELATAFDVVRDMDANDKVYAETFYGDLGVPGKFIRKGGYLNIPCPGTGMSGDPNISIELRDFMTKRVDRFIRTGKPAG